MAVNVEATAPKEGADEKLVRVLEETALHKILEKLEEPLKIVVHEAVSEAIVYATHAEPRVALPARRRSRKPASVVRQPKAGGRCAAVWTELDRLMAKNGVPTLQDVLRIGQRKKWNPNNTRVEYYQWRKAHSISGRQPSPAAA